MTVVQNFLSKDDVLTFMQTINDPTIKHW